MQISSHEWEFARRTKRREQKDDEKDHQNQQHASKHPNKIKSKQQTTITHNKDHIITIMTDTDGSKTSGTSTVVAVGADARYTFDNEKLEELRKKSPWKNDPKWFKDVTVSPTAIVKMVRVLFSVSYHMNHVYVYPMVEYCNHFLDSISISTLFEKRICTS